LKNIIIIGASGHSKVIIDSLEKMNMWNIIGYIDSFKRESHFFKYPILGTEDDILYIIKKYDVFGGVISIGDNFTRFQMVKKIDRISPNFNFISAIHPSAILGKNVQIGDGTVVMAGVIINSDSTIGKHSIINTSSTIEHDSYIGNFSTIAPNVVMGGGVQIGNFSTISIGTTIIHQIRVGDDVVVGANSLILKNVDNNTLLYGTPARIVKKRYRNDKYL